MRQPLYLLSALLFLSLAFGDDAAQHRTPEVASVEEPNFSRWYNYEDALGLSVEHERLVMLYFRSDTCEYCNQMEMFVFSDRHVDALVQQHFVIARINTSEPEGRKLEKYYRAFGTPTFIFLKPPKELRERLEPSQWQEVARLFGSRTRTTFAQELRDICAQPCAQEGT